VGQKEEFRNLEFGNRYIKFLGYTATNKFPRLEIDGRMGIKGT